MTLYEITYQRVGRHGSKHDGSPPAPLPYTLRAVDAGELAHEVLADVRRYLGSPFIEVMVNLEEMRGFVLSGVREAGAFTIAVVDEAGAPTDPVKQLEAPVLPSVTKAGLAYLQRFAAAEAGGEPVCVYQEFTKPGSGVSRPALDRLLGTGTGDALVVLGDHDPKQGRPVTVTVLGHAVLEAHQAGAL